MQQKLSIKEIRKKYREETGQDATVKKMVETYYRSGYPKKNQIEQYTPEYTQWLENLMIRLAS
jgi:hypothetical protein